MARTASGSSWTARSRSARSAGTAVPDSAAKRSICLTFGHRHDPRDDRDLAPVRRRPVDQPEVGVGVEEELRHRELRARLGLGRQHARVLLQVGRLRVPLGEGRDPHREVAQLAHQGDQLVGVAQALRVLDPRLAGAARRVAAQGQHVAHARVGVVPDHLAQLGPRGPHARQVRDRGHRRLRRDPLGDPHRAVACRAARAVRHRHERRGQRLELADRLPQVALALVGRGREELERPDGVAGRAALREQIADGDRAASGRRGASGHGRSVRAGLREPRARLPA